MLSLDQAGMGAGLSSGPDFEAGRADGPCPGGRWHNFPIVFNPPETPHRATGCRFLRLPVAERTWVMASAANTFGTRVSTD